jgi:hypothetical protein
MGDPASLQNYPTFNLQHFDFASSLQPSTFLIPFLITFLTIGSLFFLVPNGLSAAFASIPAFITSWAKISDVTAGRLVLSLFAYQPLAFLLAFIAIIRGWMRNIQRIIFLSMWLLVALLLAVFLPRARWVTLPGC